MGNVTNIFKHTKPEEHFCVSGVCMCLGCLNCWDASYPVNLRKPFGKSQNPEISYNISLKAFNCHLCSNDTVLMLDEINKYLDINNVLVIADSSASQTSKNAVKELNGYFKERISALNKRLNDETH